MLPFSLQAQWSNETFEKQLCSALHKALETTQSIDLRFVPTPTYPSPLFALPECFYLFSPHITGIQFWNTIVQGNSTYSDALTRLASSSNFSFLQLLECTLLDANGEAAPLQWSDFFAAASVDLHQLLFIESHLGVGATLPQVPLPPKVSVFQAINCNLVGAIPPNLFDGRLQTSLVVRIVNNSLEGTIPGTLFAGLPHDSMYSISISFSENQLSGSVPTELLGYDMSNLNRLTLDFTHNKLNGSLDAFMSPSITPCNITARNILIYLDYNELIGGPAAWALTPSHLLTALSLSASHNLLSGTIPANLYSDAHFGSALQRISYDFSSNQLSGSLPSNLFSFAQNGLEYTLSPWYFVLRLSQNALSSSIPAGFFDSFNGSLAYGITVDVSLNQLEGGIPASFKDTEVTTFVGQALFNFSGNQLLTGSVASSFFFSLGKPRVAPLTSSTSLSVDFSSTSLTGALVLPDFGTTTQLALSITANDANFTSIEYSPASNYSLHNLILSNNPMLSGTLPDFIFTGSSVLRGFFADNTSLSGPMPDLGTLHPSSIWGLSLEYTGIDFCAGNRSVWMPPSLYSCNLNHTSAVNCASIYPPPCFGLPPVPYEIPIHPSYVPQSQCVESTRPHASCICKWTTWYCDGRLMPETLVVVDPRNVIIDGDLASKTLLLGTTGYLFIRNNTCAMNLTHVTLNMTNKQVDVISRWYPDRNLIILEKRCYPAIWLLVELDVHVQGKTCRRLKSQPIGTSTTFAARLSVSTARCNVVLIVLLSIFGVIFLLVGLCSLIGCCVRSDPIVTETFQGLNVEPEENLKIDSYDESAK